MSSRPCWRRRSARSLKCPGTGPGSWIAGLIGQPGEIGLEASPGRLHTFRRADPPPRGHHRHQQRLMALGGRLLTQADGFAVGVRGPKHPACGPGTVAFSGELVR